MSASSDVSGGLMQQVALPHVRPIFVSLINSPILNGQTVHVAEDFKTTNTQMEL